ncbi:MAG: hypothetical protein AB7V50_04995 [Vampirovibrionia bacterium]
MTGPISFNPKIAQPQIKKTALIDDFQNKSVDIDGDNIYDLAHGEVAEVYIKAYCPNVKIKRLDIGTPGDPENIDMAKMNGALHYINDNHNDFSTVNLSGGYLIPIENLQKNIPASMQPEGGITRDNIHESEKEILTYLKQSNPQAFDNAVGMYHITKQGINIYTAAGNDKNWYNAFGAVPGVEQVGGNWPSGAIASDSAEHSDIQSYEQFGFKSVLISDKNGKPIGYDINMDNKADVPIEKTSSKGKSKGGSYILGTSFSTPVHVGKKLNIVSE